MSFLYSLCLFYPKPLSKKTQPLFLSHSPVRTVYICLTLFYLVLFLLYLFLFGLSLCLFFIACVFFTPNLFQKRHNLCSHSPHPARHFMHPKNCGLAILHKNCFLPRSAFSSSNLSVVFISTDKWNGCESYLDACIQVVLSAIPLSCAPQL